MLRQTVDPAEWEVRVKLAAAYRLVDYFGWTEQIYGHRPRAGAGGPLPDQPVGGLNYDEVTASNLVKIDVEGNVVGQSGHQVNFAGFIIHSAIHMTRSHDNLVVMPRGPGRPTGWDWKRCPTRRRVLARWSVQLARAAGATVLASSTSPDCAAALREAGVRHVVLHARWRAAAAG